MRPRQLCHQWCHFLIGAVGLEKLPHPEQVSAREAALPGHRARQVLRQAVHHAFAPDSGRQLGADVLADAPVQTDEFAVDRLVGPLAGLLDEADHLGKRGLDGLGGTWPGGDSTGQSAYLRGCFQGAHVDATSSKASSSGLKCQSRSAVDTRDTVTQICLPSQRWP